MQYQSPETLEPPWNLSLDIADLSFLHSISSLILIESKIICNAFMSHMKQSIHNVNCLDFTLPAVQSLEKNK